MTISTRPLATGDYLDPAELPKMLLALEGYVAVPYDDGAKIATIGIGINLKTVRSNLVLMLDQLGVFAHSDQGTPSGETTKQKQKRYADILADFANTVASVQLNRDTQHEAPGTSQSEHDLLAALNAKLVAHGITNRTFTFASLAEAQAVKRRFIDGFQIGPFTTTTKHPDAAAFADIGAQAKLNGLLLENLTPLDMNTYEYKALMSLYFNSSALIGRRLLDALVDDRAQAWFEIRYASNAEGANGVARRRAYEASVFGLYDGSGPDAAEALATYRMLQLNRAVISAYEGMFGAAIGSAAGNYESILQQADPNLHFTDPIYSVNDSFTAARNAMVTAVNSQDTALNLTSTDYNSLNIYVDAGRTDSLQAINENRISLLDARKYVVPGVEYIDADILMGLGGDDFLIGGRGNDVLVGGDGYDTYFWRVDDGADKIVDADGAGRIVITGTTEHFAPGTFHEVSSGVWETPDGAFRVTNASGWRLTIVASGESIALGSNFQDGYLGIRLGGPLPTNYLFLRGDQQPDIQDGVYQKDSRGNLITANEQPNRNDILHGSADPDRIEGRGGNDAIDGGAGSDILDGGDGDDLITGGAGADHLIGGAGRDIMYGGATPRAVIPDTVDQPLYVPPQPNGGTYISGWNWVVYYALDQQAFFLGNLSGVTLSTDDGNVVEGGVGDDYIVGGHGDDLVDGGADNDTAWGLGGNDAIVGGLGDDKMAGDGSSESIYLSYTPFSQHGNDTMWGGAGNDMIRGDGGNDVIFGDDAEGLITGDDVLWGDGSELASLPAQYHGADWIDGGRGNDTISGGGGRDFLFGGEGADVIYGDADDANAIPLAYSGDDEIYGGEGSDTLYGNGGNDLLVGGAGVDVLKGGAGDDIYQFTKADIAAGSNQLELIDDTEGKNRLVLGGDFVRNKVKATLVGTTVRLFVDDTGPIYALDIASGQQGIFADLSFADGVRISWDKFLRNNQVARVVDAAGGDDSFLFGGTQDDELRVAGNNITTAGGLGNDLFFGDTGSTTYLYDVGDGFDTILDPSGGVAAFVTPGVNRIVFGEGITVDDLILHYNADEGAYVEFASATGDGIRLGYFDRDDVNGGTRTLDEFEFADGSIVSWADLTSTTGFIVANLWTTDVFGTSVDDLISTSSRDEVIRSGAGNDVISFGRLSGRDIVENDTAGSADIDAIQFDSDLLIQSFELYRYGNDLVMRIWDSPDDRLLVRGFFSNSSVKELRFDTGTYTAAALTTTTWANTVNSDDNDVLGTAGADTVNAGSGNDYISGFEGNDVLTGGSGNDTLIGGAGNDTLNGGDREDTLDGGDGDDQLHPGAGITISIGPVVIVGGTVRGGAGNDTLNLLTSSGSVEFIDDEGGNWLTFGAGITRADLHVERPTTIDAEIIVRYAPGGYVSMSRSTYEHLAGVQLSTGETLSLLELSRLHDPTTATIGSDPSLFIATSLDTLSLLRRYDDLLIQYSGPAVNWVDTAGLDAKHVVYSLRPSEDFGLPPGGKVLALHNWYLAPQGSHIATLNDWITAGGAGQPIDLYAAAWNFRRWVDGTAGNDALVGTAGADEYYGFAGADTLTGGGGNDVLDGGANDDSLNGGDDDDTLTGGTGNDTLLGAAGNDEYRFAIGDGSDVISDSAGAHDVVRFGAGITVADLTVTEDASGLHVQVGQAANGDTLLITGWGLGGTSSLEGFVFDNGTTLDRAAIDLLNTGNHSPRAGDPLSKLRVRPGQPVNFALPAGALVDADAGDTLTWQVTLANGDPLPAWLSFDPVTRTFSGTPSVSDTTLLDVRLVITDAAGLSAATNFAVDVVVRYDGTSSGDSYDAPGPNSAEIYGNNGDDYLTGNSGDDEIYGGAGIDSLHGGAGNDLIVGGTGNDLLYDGDGADTYRFNLGDGSDELPFHQFGSDDVIEFGAGISAQYVLTHMRLESGGLMLRYNPGSALDSLWSRYWEVPVQAIASSGLQLRFASGESLTLAQVFAAMNVITQGDDSHFVFDSNPVHGLGGNDTILAADAAGSVEIYGDEGDDVISASNASGPAHIEGGAGDDRLSGTSESDLLIGGAGDDVIHSDLGSDVMQGGEGNDTYELDLQFRTDGAQIEITDTSGFDVIQLGFTSYTGVTFTRVGDDMVLTRNVVGGPSILIHDWYVDPANRIERMQFSGNSFGDYVLTAEQVEARVSGANSAPSLMTPRLVDLGVAVNGSLSYSAGNYFRDLEGSLTYTALLSSGAALPAWLTISSSGVVSGTPASGNVGTYRVVVTATDAEGLAVSDELVVVVATTVTQGTASGNTYNGTTGNDTYFGQAGSDRISGGNGTDQLFGGADDDTLNGGQGDDILVGGAGSDVLIGGAGTNQFWLDPGDGADTHAMESSGTQRFVFGRGITLADVHVTLSRAADGSIDAKLTYTTDVVADVLRLTGVYTLSGSALVLNPNAANYTFEFRDGTTRTLAQILDLAASATTGTAGHDILSLGAAGALSGGDGDDVLFGSADVDTLDGGDGSDQLFGNGGADILIGGAGNDGLNGGAGVDDMTGGLGDDSYTVDSASDVIHENDGEGTDTVLSTATYTLAQYVENLTLAGTTAINGTGNGLDNILIGNDQVNNLSGGAGNDYINGMGGVDVMSGGQGDDVFIVGSSNETITESANEGIDRVESSVAITTLANNVEVLFLTANVNGGGNGSNNLIRGFTGTNSLTGGAGIDILEGLGGTDTLSDNVSNGGNSMLNGGAGADTLTGNTVTATNDLFIGGADNDTITTGSGADVIAFNLGDGQDTVAVSTTRDNTISIGGGATFADLVFQKTGNNLILKVGSSSQIQLTNFYAAAANHSVNTLQIVIEGTSDYDANSADATRNKKVQTFNFEGLVTAFGVSGLTTWALTNALAAQHLSGSDTAAIGGDLAYRYGRFGNLSDIAFTPATAILGAGTFGSAAQALQSLSSLQDSSPRLS